jgi:excisionase family DNA binding protein
MSAARMPFERPGASNADDEANDGRPPLARSSKPKTFSDTPKLALTLEEAAAELSVSTATIRRMITRGSLRAVSLGDGPRARRRVSRSALEEFLNAER